MPSQQDIAAALAGITGPDGRPLPQSGMLGGIVVREDRVFISLEAGQSGTADLDATRAAIEDRVNQLPGVGAVFVTITAERTRGGPSHQPAPPPAAHAHAHAPGPKAQAARTAQTVPGVKTIIAVASGKGGVGKSTTACNLALALSGFGLSVGILDADIYGPSMPRLLGLTGKPEVVDGRMMRPLEAWGVKVMSIGFLVEEETPMIWRGPMVMSALTQMLREVRWGELDVMVVDMPPGTGDAQLTMAQSVPLAGAVIVSTPQDLALIDARRGIAMFKRTEVPIIGIVENMSTFICPHCGQRSDIFNHGGAKHEAERLGVPYLGEVPLAMNIRESSDAGRPIVVSDPSGPQAEAYKAMARAVLDRLAGSRQRAAPRIVVE
jgi:ATP-binding protein involved in chromosome partitioning